MDRPRKLGAVHAIVGISCRRHPSRLPDRESAVQHADRQFWACGIVPDELDEDVAESVGAAFVRLTGAPSVVTVHDMRTSSRPLAEAFGRGAASPGADVIEVGLGSTDMLYYASGSLGMPGAMITASHNPAKYNGIKLCREGARPVGRDDLGELVHGGSLSDPPPAHPQTPPLDSTPGTRPLR